MAIESEKLASINTKTRRDTRVLVMEPPNRFPKDAGRRPNGALGPVYLAGALRREGFDVDYLDAAVGTPEQNLEDVYLRQNEPDEKGLVHIGMSDDEIKEAVKDYQIIAVSNIFTLQTKTALRIGHLVREANPDAILIAGGVNAEAMPNKFIDEGYDAVCRGEGEELIVDIATAYSRHESWRDTPGLIHRVDGKQVLSGLPRTTMNLDTLPEPAFDLWPLEKYWEASAPHGGDFPPGMQVRYASMQTSRGCPFECSFCHVSFEKAYPEVLGPIGKLRQKSIDRVLHEVDTLQSLGVEWLFFEDDSLLANVPRAIEIFKRVDEMGLNLADVNGVNLVHLFKRGENRRLVPNGDLIGTMAESGFKQLVLPFESASPRIIQKYATNKWNPETMDVVELVKVAKEHGLKVPGNFMIGFPDETQEELNETVELARKLIQNGLDYASFFIVTPYPRSALHEYALENGYLDGNLDPDELHWGNPVMKNTAVPPEELLKIRTEVYREINSPEFVEGKLGRNVIPEPHENR